MKILKAFSYKAGLVLLLAGCGGGTSQSPTTHESHAEASDTSGANSAATSASPETRAALERAIGGAHRSAENKSRDSVRHPKETLAFFRITPQMTVIELSPGAGWYTEILAPLLREQGKLIIAAPDPNGERRQYIEPLIGTMAAHPEIYQSVQRVVFEPPTRIELGADGSADLVLAMRALHGLVRNDAEDETLAAILRVLKPGGYLGVEQHRAADGTDLKRSAETGYLPEAGVIQLIERAGFELVDKSEINANPRDTRDHPNGVWSLPPTLRGGDQDRAQFEAIGESDRMTLLFRKPAR